MRKFLALSLALIGGAAYWAALPRPLAPADVAGLTGDATRGASVYHAAGCASCHMAPGATGAAQDVLAGGQRFATAFGTFVAPNISSDPAQGIGGWSLQDFASAVMRGVSPDGAHYFPAFPYAAYQNATLQDMADLHAFMATLPADPTPRAAHEVGFPFNIRAAIGGWKMLFGAPGWAVTGDLTTEESRGRYLAEALAHCGECHTPRNALGGLDRAQWLRGAPNPSGQGRIPGIAPDQLDWSVQDIAIYLETGFTPDYDSAGGHMAHVVENFARLPESDRLAVAAYLKKVPVAP